MKNVSSILVLGIMALAMSCNSSLIGDPDIDSVDWGSVKENIVFDENNQRRNLNGDWECVMLATYDPYDPDNIKKKDKYDLIFRTTLSDNYVVGISISEPIIHPINENGELSFKNYVDNGHFFMYSKEKQEKGEYLHLPSKSCKVLINGNVKQQGGYKKIESKTYGEPMKGNIQIKVKMIIDAETLIVSFDKLIPYLDDDPEYYVLRCN